MIVVVTFPSSRKKAVYTDVQGVVQDEEDYPEMVLILFRSGLRYPVMSDSGIEILPDPEEVGQ